MKNNVSEEIKDISDDFKDIEKEKKSNYYIIVPLLYAIVIILTILLVIGLNHQKTVVKDNLNLNNLIQQNK